MVWVTFWAVAKVKEKLHQGIAKTLKLSVHVLKEFVALTSQNVYPKDKADCLRVPKHFSLRFQGIL